MTADSTQEPAARPPRWFNIDGTRHSIGNTTYCRCNDECRKCGAREHVQGGWGNLFRVCESCDFEDSTDDISEAGEP